MRGTLFIGLIVVMLIVGLLVMKNMGVDKSDGVTETQAEQYIEKAQRAADKVGQQVKSIDVNVSDTD